MPIMAEMDISRNLLSSRSALLKASLENSRAIASALHRTGQKLDRIGRSLPPLEAAARPFPAQKCTFAAITDHVDRAVGPAAAVLNVHGTIQVLRKSVSADLSSGDLYAYLSSLKQLEEALKFLGNNCGLAIQWLQDILRFLEDNSVANEPYVCNVQKSLRILLELEATEKRARIDGGVLFGAFRKLETEYKQLLVENSVPVPLAIYSSSVVGKMTFTTSPAIPVDVVEKLQAITERLKANDRLSWCTSAYVEVRVANAKRSLEGIDLNYLDKPIIGSDAEEVDGWIDQWSKHLELIVKNIFEVEFNLSKDVFCSTPPDISIGCFTEIATRSGILSFLQFGRKVTESNKDAIKLLKLLDIFTALDNLRGDFNRLFGGTSCLGIRSQTRSLIKSVVDGARKIFLGGLADEVSRQREVFPASNGCVPRLVSFVTEYCNELLGDKYRPLLEKVLMIHQSWKQEKYQDELLTSQICHVLKEIGLNLDLWSKAHVDAPLSYLFMMNNHCHFSNLRGTKLGDLMGDAWLKAHEQYKDHFMALYLRESWGKVIGHLRPDGQAYSSSPAKVSTKGLKAFNQAFDNLYRKQSSWVVPDESLRLRICKLLVQSLVPVYRSYLQSYKLLIEQDPSAEKHVKYTTQGLETMLSSLFQQKMTKYRLNRHAYWISKIKDVMSDNFRPTLMAA